MYKSSERAGIFGWYLLGPLLGKCTNLPDLCCVGTTSLPSCIAPQLTSPERSHDRATLRRHRRLSPVVALALLDNDHSMRDQYYNRLLFPPGVVCTGTPGPKESQAGSEAEGRGRRGRQRRAERRRVHVRRRRRPTATPKIARKPETAAGDLRAAHRVDDVTLPGSDFWHQ